MKALVDVSSYDVEELVRIRHSDPYPTPVYVCTPTVRSQPIVIVSLTQ